MSGELIMIIKRIMQVDVLLIRVLGLPPMLMVSRHQEDQPVQRLKVFSSLHF